MKKLAINTFRVKRFNKLMGFAGALQNIPVKVTPFHAYLERGIYPKHWCGNIDLSRVLVGE
jgi:hypothetical protein